MLIRKLLSFALIPASFIQINAQEDKLPTVAPLDSAFNEYIHNKDTNIKVIPEPVKYIFPDSFKYKKKAALPAKYDLRTAGANNSSMLTPVKDQGQCGACWTFAALASLECYVKKSGLGTYDFSENNLKECSGFTYDPCGGGNNSMSVAYLTRLNGPIDESADPYYESGNGCKTNLSPLFYVNNTRIIHTDATSIKQAIFDYGTISTTMYMDESYLNDLNNTYYYSGSQNMNHLVTLVGWDDNKVTNGGTGAWIIKNSWGASWGDKGYFYISYNDTKINSENLLQFRGINNVNSSTKLFYYDKLGFITNMGYSANIAYALIRFDNDNQIRRIRQVSTYISTANSVVAFEIYDNFTNNTLKNLLAKTDNKTCTLPGYYSFDLTTPIYISADNDFYIKVYYNTPGNLYPIPMESPIINYADAEIETDKCWISSNGGYWTPIGSTTDYKNDLCIRALADDLSTDIAQLSEQKNISISPNPANDNIRISLKEKFSSGYTIDIIDITGKKLGSFHKQSSDLEYELPLHNIPSGVLILNFHSANREFKDKVIKR